MQISNTVKVIILILVIGIPVSIIIYLTTRTPGTNDQMSQTATTTVMATSTVPESPASDQKYKDGTYSATGHYTSPGGPETVPVTLTLKDDIITDVSFVSVAVLPISQNFQGKFISGYKPLVIGKNIDDVKLTKVSGSSLTPKGFNDAIAQIKVEAQS